MYSLSIIADVIPSTNEFTFKIPHKNTVSARGSGIGSDSGSAIGEDGEDDGNEWVRFDWVFDSQDGGVEWATWPVDSEGSRGPGEELGT